MSLISDLFTRPRRRAPLAPVIEQRRHARNGAAAMRGIRAEAPVEPQREVYVPAPFRGETLAGLERHIEKCLQDAADLDAEAMRLMDLAQQRRVAAQEHERLLWLARTVPGEPARGVIDEAAVSAGELGRLGPEPMRSTDPDTPHRWTITVTEGGELLPDGEETYTDAELEAIADQYGDRAAVTYARHEPWQAGQRHLTTLAVRSRDGGHAATYTRAEAGAELPEALASEPLGAPPYPTQVLHAGNDFLLPVCEAASDPSASLAVAFTREIVSCPACLAILDAADADPLLSALNGAER